MPKLPKCKVCKQEFTRFRPLQQVCSPKCAAEHAKKTREKKERVEHRKAKEGIKTWAKWNSEAQAAFNKVRRLMDKNESCGSCGRTNEEVLPTDGWRPGGAWDCGHYKTRGAFPELRFILINAHKQCKSCNGGSGKYTRKNHTVGKEYRIRLIEKIGLHGVEYLEGPQPRREYSIEDLKEIKQGFNEWARELERLWQV